jgi:hypothetical protein
VDEASCCQVEFHVAKLKVSQAADGTDFFVAGSFGDGLQVPNRYEYQPQGPLYLLSDQTLSAGASDLS